MDYKVAYMKGRDKVEDTSSGPSSGLWGLCPLDDIKNDMAVGFIIEDDFVNTPQMISDQDVAKYASYIDTGVTITQAALVGGVLQIAGNDADNDEGSIQAGGNTGAPFVITDGGTEKKLWFEAKIKKASVDDNGLAFFVGLAEEGLAAANTLVDDTGEVADKDLIGFQCLNADGDALVFCYRKAGGAKQTVALDSALAELTADTYVKVGFYFDPDAPTTERIKIYVNGVENSTSVTAANIAAATFPDGEELAPLFATKVGAAAEVIASMDFWRTAQLR